MSMRFSTKIALPSMIALVIAGTGMPGEARDRDDDGRSPALCGPDDNPEPGIQGDVPAGETANYNCGLTLLAELPRIGAVQGAGHCAYVRSGGRIWVVDVSDPSNPTEIGDVPTFGGSETMRAVVTDERAVLVSGRGVYDISDCENPVLKGEIQWPPGIVITPGLPPTGPPHDIRINGTGTEVYASFGIYEADITNLDDPSTWTVTNHTCDVAAQYHPLHELTFDVGISLCDFNFSLWPQLSHGPATNEAGTRLYVGDQAAGSNARWEPEPHLRVIDVTQDPPQILKTAPGPGHSVDWFRTADGREFVLHANETGPPGIGDVGDTCQRRRPEVLGWAFEAFVTEVTRDKARRVSKLELAINKPEFCEARQASGQSATVAYHSIDNPADANFATVSFGGAGLRVFDIRNPKRPIEVAYFNHGPLVHAGVSYYDASRGLIYAPGSDGFKVLEIQPQVREHLGLDE